MPLEQFTTDAYPVHQRPQAWRAALQTHRLRPAIGPAAAPLYGTLTARSTARGVEMARITSSPQTLQRLGHAADAIWIALHMGGAAALHHGRERIELAPGDIVFGPAHAQADLDFRSDFRQFVVSMPRASLKARLPGGQAFALGHLCGSTGLGRMFAGTLTTLADAFDSLADADIAPVESALSEFIATSMAAQRELAAPAISSTGAATLRRLCQYVDANLSDAGLTLFSRPLRHVATPVPDPGE